MNEKNNGKHSYFKIVLIVIAVIAAIAAIAAIVCAVRKKRKAAACECTCDCDCDELFFDDDDFGDDVEVEIADAIEA
jgi:flagellar basal body-associated protein FliL